MLIKTFIFKLVKTTDINIIFLRQQLNIKVERKFRISISNYALVFLVY